MANVRSSYRSRRSGLYAGAGLLTATLLLTGGCVSTDPATAPPTIVHLDLPGMDEGPGLRSSDFEAERRPALRLASLGSGDALGMTIRLNDIVLAAAKRLGPDDAAAIVEVPLED